MLIFFIFSVLIVDLFRIMLQIEALQPFNGGSAVTDGLSFSWHSFIGKIKMSYSSLHNLRFSIYMYQIGKEMKLLA